MDIRVDLPDGTSADFPEGTSEDVMRQAIEKKFGTKDRIRRATGDQDGTGEGLPPLTPQPGTEPDPNPEPEEDPLADIVTEINGVTLTGEERQAMAHAKTIQDPQEKRRIAARLAARIDRRSGDGNFADQVSRNGVGAALRGFTNVFGIGDMAAAAGTTLGSDLSFTDALELQQEMRRALEEDYPLISLGSEIAGAVIGGGGVGLGVKALSKGTKIAPAVNALTGLQKGQGVRNAAKVSAIGAAEGAITEGVTEDNAGSGALIGAAGGPAGLALAKTLGVGASVFARGLNAARGVTRQSVQPLVTSSSAKGMKILAKKLDEPVEDLMMRFQQIKALTGKPPTIAELSNKNAALELRELLENSPDATKKAQELAETNLSTRAQEIGDNLSGGGPTTTKAGLTAAQKKQGDELFKLSHKDDIPFTPEQVTRLLENADLRKALPATLRNEIDDVIQAAGGKPITLKGKDVDDIRQVLNERIGAGFKTRFRDLSNEIQDIGRAGSHNFAKAMDEFAKAGERIEGQALGASAIKGKTGELVENVAQASPRVTKAAEGGARTAIKDTASENLAGAKRLVNELTTESGTITRLKQILPKQELDLIRETARAQKDSLESLGAATPRTTGKQGQDILPTLVNAVVLASPTTSPASKVFSTGRLLTSFKRLLGSKADDRMLKNLAEDAFDPAKTEAVLQALRRAGVDDSEIINAFMSAAGGASAAQGLADQ